MNRCPPPEPVDPNVVRALLDLFLNQLTPKVHAAIVEAISVDCARSGTPERMFKIGDQHEWLREICRKHECRQEPVFAYFGRLRPLVYVEKNIIDVPKDLNWVDIYDGLPDAPFAILPEGDPETLAAFLLCRMTHSSSDECVSVIRRKR